MPKAKPRLKWLDEKPRRRLLARLSDIKSTRRFGMGKTSLGDEITGTAHYDDHGRMVSVVAKTEHPRYSGAKIRIDDRGIKIIIPGKPKVRFRASKKPGLQIMGSKTSHLGKAADPDIFRVSLMGVNDGNVSRVFSLMDSVGRCFAPDFGIHVLSGATPVKPLYERIKRYEGAYVVPEDQGIISFKKSEKKMSVKPVDKRYLGGDWHYFYVPITEHGHTRVQAIRREGNLDIEQL